MRDIFVSNVTALSASSCQPTPTCRFACCAHAIPPPPTTTQAPLCRSFCNSWYDACKDDYSCVRDWINDWNYTDPTVIKCPDNAPCKCVQAGKRARGR